MLRVLLLVALAATLSCVKEKKTAEYKTSDLVPHFSRTVVGGVVDCGAWFSLESDTSNFPVMLESDALVICNGTIMTRSVGGTYYQGSTPYTPGVQVRISLIRQIDGTNLTDTQQVF